MSWIILDTPSRMECGDCKRPFYTDTLTTYDRGDQGHELTSLCDKCLSKYPKRDGREWRREEHPDQFGIVTWMDGSKSFVDSDGMLRDVYEADSGEECCSACFVASHDEQRGFATVAMPEGCGDEDCDCHNQAQPAVPVDYFAAVKESFKTTCLACVVGGIAFGWYLATVIQGGAR